MAADLALILVLVGGFVVGVLRGALRQLVALGAWLVCFVLAAHLRSPLAELLAGQLTQFSRAYLEMLAFVGLFAVLLGITLAIIELGGSTIQLSRRPLVDNGLGGLLLLGVTLLAIGGLVIALRTYYAADTADQTQDVALLTELNTAFEGSVIVGALEESLVPGLHAILGPLLPSDVRVVR